MARATWTPKAGRWVTPILVLVLSAVAVLSWNEAEAAFTATAAGAGNSLGVAELRLSDDDAGSALLTVTGLQPGDTGQECIAVTYTGSTPADVRLYVAPGDLTGTGLAPYLTVTVEESLTGGFGSCAGFAFRSIDFSGTLAGFASTSTGPATGVGSFSPARAGQSSVFRISYALADDNASQGLTARVSFTWDASAPAGRPYELPTGYTLCAVEGDTCSFAGTRTVAYGAGTAYTYQPVTATAACTAATFGTDPVSDLLKSCYVAPLGGPQGHTLCSAYASPCVVPLTRRSVVYGLNGAFRSRVLPGQTVNCTGAAFGGDPLQAVGGAKNCYLAPATGPSSDWSQCATESNPCATVPGQPVAFGRYGAFRYAVATGTGTPCTVATFGEPLFGESKACFVRPGAPAGFPVTCAAENGSCGFVGTRTVAFGAWGAFTYRTFTDGALCTGTAFGRDPLNGVVKSCYLTS